jgi:hypothetical protein
MTNGTHCATEAHLGMATIPQKMGHLENWPAIMFPGCVQAAFTFNNLWFALFSRAERRQ